MTTIIVNIPDKKADELMNYFKRYRLRTRIVKAKEDEKLVAKWIDEGMKSGEVSEEEIFEVLKKNGVKI